MALLEFFTIPALKARGWTDALIRDHLGQHDATKTNPHYRSGPPMRLFKRVRVEEFEQSEHWPSLLERSSRRKASALAAAQKKRQQLLDYVAGLEISVKRLSWQALVNKACKHYN